MKQTRTLNEVYTNIPVPERIFYSLSTVNSGDIIPPWHGIINESSLDITYFLQHSGNKKVSGIIPYYLNLNNVEYITSGINDDISKIIKDMYIKKWVELYNTLNFEYNPISNYDMTENETINNTNSGSETINSNESHTGTTTNKTTGTNTDNEKNNNTITYTPTGSEQEETTKSGEENNIINYNGGEEVEILKTGNNTDTTTYSGNETTTQGGIKTTNRTFMPEGEEVESYSKTDTYNNITDTNTQWGFNSTLLSPPDPQNASVKTGSTTYTGNNTKSFTNRMDSENITESFDNYNNEKSFTNRKDETEHTYNIRDTTNKTFDNRNDSTTLSFNNRKDINIKSYNNRIDTTTETKENTINHVLDTTQQLTNNLSFTNTGNNTTTNTEEVKRTLTRSGNIGVTTTQQMIQSQRDILLWDYFFKVVFPDIDKLITLSIY